MSLSYKKSEIHINQRLKIKNKNYISKCKDHFLPFKVSILEANILAISVVSFKSLLVLSLLVLPESLSKPNQNLVSLDDFKA